MEVGTFFVVVEFVVELEGFVAYVVEVVAFVVEKEKFDGLALELLDPLVELEHVVDEPPVVVGNALIVDGCNYCNYNSYN